jgi:hypothetical protein
MQCFIRRRQWLRARLLLVALLGGVCDGQRICDVTSYGAVGDGVTQNIGAIRTALADCGGAGGGVLRFPTGDFLGAPFNLTSNMVLDVRGTLRGTTNLSLVPLMAPFPSMGGNITRDGHACRFAPLVGAFRARNITITGGGVIDGAGAWWWDHRHAMDVEPPRLVELQHVVGVTVRNITLTNSPFWTLHPIYSRDILIRNVTITAEGKGQYGENTDGIDPDSCQNVLIEDYTYCAGDDAVAVKSGWNWAGQHVNISSRNITVRNARSGCRGGFTIGSEMSGGVADVLFEDCVSTGESGIRISSELGRGGFVRNVTFRNISFSWDSTHTHKAFLLHVNQDYKPDNPNKTLCDFTNVSFEGLRVTAAPEGFELGDITCLEQSACEGINLRDITLAPTVQSPKPLACSHIASGAMEGVGAALAPPGCTTSNSTPPSPPPPPPPPSPSPTGALSLQPCGRGGAAARGQQWSFDGHDLRSLAMGNASSASAMCLDMSKHPPYPVSLYACHAPPPQQQGHLGDDQAWGFSGSSSSGATEGELLMLGYIPAGESAPRCLDGAALRADVCSGTTTQQWKLAATGDATTVGILHNGDGTHCLTYSYFILQ